MCSLEKRFSKFVWVPHFAKMHLDNKRSGVIETVDDKLKDIVGQTSRTVTPAPN